MKTYTCPAISGAGQVDHNRKKGAVMMRAVMMRVARIQLLVLSLLFVLLPAAARAGDCIQSNCTFGSWTLTPVGGAGFLVDTTTSDTGQVITSWSHDADGVGLTAATLTHATAGDILTVFDAVVNVYTSYPTDDPSFVPTSNEVYLTASGPVTIGFWWGAEVQASSAKIDLSDDGNVRVQFMGTIEFGGPTGGQPSRMVGMFEVTLTASGSTRTAAVTGFAVGSNLMTGLGSCQPGSDQSPISVGNAALIADQVCLGSSGIYLSGNIYMKYYAGLPTGANVPSSLDTAAAGFRLPITSLTLGDAMSAVPLNGGTITLAEGVVVETDRLLPQAAGSGSIVKTGSSLQIGQLSLTGWVADIDLKTLQITRISQASDTPQDLIPGNPYSGDWYGTFIGSDFYLGNRLSSVGSGAYGFMVDTANPSNWWYRDLNGFMVQTDANTSYDSNQNIIFYPSGILLNRPILHFATSTDPGYPYKILGAGDDGMPSLVVSDYGGNYDANYQQAVAALAADPAYGFSMGGGKLSFPADYVVETSLADGQEYLYAQLPLAGGDMYINVGSDPMPPFYEFPSTKGGWKIQGADGAFSSVSLDSQGDVTITLESTTDLLYCTVSADQVQVFQIGPDEGHNYLGYLQTLSGARLEFSETGTVDFLPPVTLETDNNTVAPSIIRTFQNRVTLDLVNKTLFVHPDADAKITINDTVIECPSGLTVGLAAGQQVDTGRFTGSFGNTTAEGKQAFSFFGDGTYDFLNLRIAGIERLDWYGAGYYATLNVPQVFLGMIGLSSGGFWSGSYQYANGILTGGDSDYHFVHPPAASSADDFTFHSVTMSVDVAANKISAVSSPSGQPKLTYTDPAGVGFTVETTNNTTATIEMAADGKIRMTGTDLWIHDTVDPEGYQLDGSLTIDYENRSITNISPEPGTGLVLNRHMAVFGDSFTSESGFAGVQVNGGVQVGPAKIKNTCADSGVICMSWDGDFTFDFDTNQVTGISINGALNVPVDPDNPAAGLYAFNPFNNPTPIAGSTFVKGTLGNGIQVVVDLNRRQVAAAGAAGSPTLVWGAAGARMVYDYATQTFSVEPGGQYVMGTADTVPAGIDVSVAPTPVMSVTSGGSSNVTVGASGTTASTQYVVVGDRVIATDAHPAFIVGINHNSTGGSIEQLTEQTPLGTISYWRITKPYIWVVRDSGYTDPAVQNTTTSVPTGEPILYYDGTIVVGRDTNVISSTEADGEKAAYYLWARNIITTSNAGGTDLRLSNEHFKITTNGWHDQQDQVRNTLVFFGDDDDSQGTVLPDITFPSVFMALERQDMNFSIPQIDFRSMGVWTSPFLPQVTIPTTTVPLNTPLHTYRFDLYHDHVTTRSSFANFGAEFFGGSTPGLPLSLGLDAAFKAGKIDIELDPTVVLSQVVGQSRARMKFGVKDPMTSVGGLKDVPWYSKMASILAKSSLSFTGTSNPETMDLFRVDLDFLTQEFGGEMKFPVPFLMGLTGGGAMLSSFTDMTTAALYLTLEIKMNDGTPWLDTISTTLKLPEPFIIVPEEPAGFGLDEFTLTVDKLADYNTTDTGKLDIKFTANAPLRDPEDVLLEVNKYTGRDLLLADASVDVQFDKLGDFSLTIGGDAKLLDFIPLASLSAGLSIDNGVDEFFFNGDMNIFGIFDGNIGAKMTLVPATLSSSITASGSLSLTIPHGIPIVGGRSFGGLGAGMDVETQYGQLDLAEVYAGFSVHILFVNFSFDVGADLAPNFHFFARRDGEMEIDPADVMTLYMGETTPVELAGGSLRSNDAPVEVTLEAGKATPMLALTGTEAAPEFDVVFPDGTRYRFDECWQGAPEDTPYPDTIFFLVDEGSRTTYAALNHPEAGTYVLVPASGAAGELSLSILDPAPAVEGTLTGSAEQRDLRAGEGSLSLTLSGVRDAEVTFYATATKKANMGVAISPTYSGLTDGTHELPVDLTSDRLHSGWFYVYAKVRDRRRVPRFVWMDDMLMITNPAAPPVPENVTAVEQGDVLVIDWTEEGDSTAVSYQVHVFEAGESDPAHSHYYQSASTEFTARGLAPETDYEIVVEAVNDAGVKAYSRPLSVTTSASAALAGAPDLEVDIDGTRELTMADWQLTLKVCNTGTADAQSGEVDVFYKQTTPAYLIKDVPVGSVAAGQCVPVPVNVTGDKLDLFRGDTSDRTEAVIVSVDNVVPTEHATGTGNFKHISFPEPLFARRMAVTGAFTGQGGEPLAGVTVTLVEAGLTTTTAADGSFAFDNVIAEVDYTLRVVPAGVETPLLETTVTPADGDVLALGELSTLPDLVVESLTGPETARAGSVLGQYVSLVIANRGLTAAVSEQGDIVVDLVLSTDPVIGNDDDVPLADGSYLVSETIGPESSLPFPLNGRNTIPESTVPGSYYLGVTVDSGVSRVEESDETNNSSILPMAITEQFELLQYLPGFLHKPVVEP